MITFHEDPNVRSAYVTVIGTSLTSITMAIVGPMLRRKLRRDRQLKRLKRNMKQRNKIIHEQRRKIVQLEAKQYADRQLLQDIEQQLTADQE
jgi:hypothetical protein